MTITNADTLRAPLLVATDANGNVTRIGLTADTVVGFCSSDGTEIGRKLKMLGAVELARRVVSVATSERVLSTDTVLLVDSSVAASSATVVLPALTANADLGRLVVVKDVAGLAATKNIVLDPGTGVTIDGSSSYTLAAAYAAVGVMWTGTMWTKLFVPDTGGSGGGDPAPTYVVNASTGSLPNALVLTAGTGLVKSVGGGLVTLAINDGVVATVSGSTFTGAVKFNAGLSGSLTTLQNGTSYLVAGSNVTIASSSNGQVVISAASSGTGSNSWIDSASNLRTTASVAIDSSGNFASQIASDVYLYVSGTTGLTGSSAKIALFRGDVRVSGSLTVGSGSVTITSNDVQFGASTTKIEKSGSNMSFRDLNNTGSHTLSWLAYNPMTRWRHYDLTHSPVALWKLDGNLNDSSGNGLTLSVRTGTARYAEVVPGVYGFYSDGSTILYRASADALLQIDNAITIQAIVKLHSYQTANTHGFLCMCASAGESLETNYLYWITATQPTGYWNLLWEYGVAGTNSGAHPMTPFRIGDSHVICFTRSARDGSSNCTAKFYIDGVLMATTASVPGAQKAGAANTQQFGLLGDWQSPSQPIGACSIASVKIIASELTADQVLSESNYVHGF